MHNNAPENIIISMLQPSEHDEQLWQTLQELSNEPSDNWMEW